MSVELRLFSITAKDLDHLDECNQDFVAPTPYHIPLWAARLVTPLVAPALCHMRIEVVSVRVREHQHSERTPSGIVFGVEQRERYGRHSEVEWDNEGIFGGGLSGTKGEMIRQNIQESEWIMRTERSISSIRKERLILLFNPSSLKRRLAFCVGILQFWITNQKQPASAFAQSNRETESSNAVDDKSKRFDKNSKVVQQGINISWHHTLLSGFDFFCLQFMSHCHLWAFLLSSR